MALNTIPYIPQDGVITITDGTGSPLTCTVVYEDGDMNISELSATQAEDVRFFDRGTLYAVRRGQVVTPTISFSCHLTDFTDATAKNILDVLLWRGTWSAAVSTFPGAQAVDVKLTLDSSSAGSGGGPSSITLYGVTLKGSIAEGSPMKLSLSGTVNGDGSGTFYAIT